MKKLYLIALFALMLLVSLITLAHQPDSHPDTPLYVGFLGDSTTDEYRGSDNRGGEYSSGTYNWMELLVMYRNLHAGAWDYWPEPRREGYEYNWSRSAATTRTLIEQGQHIGLANQVRVGLVDMVIVNIGINDFALFNGNYAAVYNGQISGAALDQKVEQMITDYTTAVDTILEAGDVPVIVTTVGNQSMTPSVLADPRFADPAKRQRVSDTIQRVNEGIIRMADERGLIYFDSEALYLELEPQLQTGFQIGSLTIDFFGIGNEPHNGILGDGTHTGTAISALLSNEYLNLMNQFIEPDIPLLTDEEILAAIGL